MKRISLIALLAALVSCSTNADRPAPPAPVAPDADAVRAAVQHTFDGLAAHDIMGVVEVIHAAGGIVTDKTGAAVTMQGTDSLLAASTPELHAAALALAGKSG